VIVGLSGTLPHTMLTGLTAHGVSHADAQRVADLPPVSILFAAFLGYNPIQSLLGAKALAKLPAAQQHAIVGRSFFPHLISGPFRHGLHEAFLFAIIACLIAAAASWSRGSAVDSPRGQSADPDRHARRRHLGRRSRQTVSG
jgi:hypothetical protein